MLLRDGKITYKCRNMFFWTIRDLFLWLQYIENANDDVYVPYCEESLALYPEATHTLTHKLTLLLLDAFIVCMS